jgi:eukaryotic-like serine/threonine-protein kinase
LVRIQQRLERTPYADTYDAIVISTSAPCLVYICSSSELSSGQHRALTASFSTRRKLIHKNLTGCAGVGEDQNHFFLAEALSEGRQLSEHLARRRAVGRLFTPSEAYTLVSHVCNGLQFAQEHGHHGLVSPENITVLKTGRVQVCRLGFNPRRALLVESRGQLNEWEQGHYQEGPFGINPDVRSLALLTLQLVRCEPFIGGLSAATEALRDELPAALTELLERCAGTDAIPTIGEFRRALKNALRDLRAERALLKDERPQELSAPPPLPAEMLFDDAMEVVPTGSFDHLSEHIIAAPSSETLRWLVERDGVDYGPYTQAQVLAQLDTEALRPQSVIVDIETDERRPLAEFEDFENELLRFVHRKDDRDTQKRKDEHERSTVNQRRLMVWGGGSAALLLLLVIGGWRYHLSTLPEPVRANLATLVHPIDWPLPTIMPPDSAEGILDEPTRVVGKRSAAKSRRRGATGNESARMRREERLAAQSELVMGSGSGASFDRAAFDRVIARRMRGIYKCLTGEVKRNTTLKAVHVSMAVLPKGDIINVKAPAMSKAGQRCVRGVLRGARVRPFDGINVKITLPYRFE